MKRIDIISDLIKEGFKEKTLINFTDKQIKDLHERIMSEATKTLMTTYDSKKPEDVKALNAALHDPKTDHSTINVKENKKLSNKQSEKMDTDKDGDIDAKDLKNLRNKKKEDTNESLSGLSQAYVLDKLEKSLGRKPKQSEIEQAYNEIKKEFEKYVNKTKSTKSEKKKDTNESEMNESKKWIQKAVHPSKKGSLRKALGVKKGEKIPAEKLKSAAKKVGKLGQRARFAMNVKGLKESKQDINEWIDELVKETYHPLTSKENIIKFVQKKTKK